SDAVPDRAGSLRQRPLLGPNAVGAGSRSAVDPSAACQAVRSWQQERRGRCAGDLERGSATRDALGAVKERTAASHALAAPSARAVDQSENANGQRLAWAALRVWGAVARRSTSGSEGHYCQPRRDR